MGENKWWGVGLGGGHVGTKNNLILFFFLLTDGTLQGSYFLNLCKNLERNNLSGSLPAALLDKSKSGSLLLRSPFCHNFLCHVSFSLLSHYKKNVKELQSHLFVPYV